MPTPDDDVQPPEPVFVNPDDALEPAPPAFVPPGGATAQSTTTGAPVFVKPGELPPPPAPSGAARPQPSTSAGGFARPTYVTADGTVVAPGDPGGAVIVTSGPSPRAAVQLTDDRPWRWWVGPLAVLVAFMAVIGLSFLVAAAVAVAGGDVSSVVDDNEQWFGLGQDLSWIAVVMLVPFMVARYLQPEQLGLRRAPFWRSVGVMAVTMVAFYALAAAYSLALGLDDDSNTLLKDSGFGDSVTSDVIYALVFTVAAPVAEELLFRGLLFRTLRDGLTRYGRKRGIAMAAVLSGVFFGLIHVGGGQDDYLPVLALLGILLALAYQWSGTLYVTIAIHSINNAVATGATADVSADWIKVLIGFGPVLALAFAFLISRFIKIVFPQERPGPLDGLGVPTSGEPANL